MFTNSTIVADHGYQALSLVLRLSEIGSKYTVLLILYLEKAIFDDKFLFCFYLFSPGMPQARQLIRDFPIQIFRD